METCCGYGYGPARESHRLPRIFKGRQRLAGRRRSRGALTGAAPLSPDEPIPGARALTKKRQLFPGSSAGVSGLGCVAAPGPSRARSPCPGCGILTASPFGRPRGAHHRRPASERVSPIPQGRLTHVQLLFTWNPSPSSVLKALTRVFATTTKICAGGGSRRARARHLPRPRRGPPTRRGVRMHPQPRRPGMGSTLERHPFSGLVASAGELLHTPWRVPTSVATVLLSGATNTFHGVSCASRIGRRNPAFGSSRSASPAYQERPTGRAHPPSLSHGARPRPGGAGRPPI